MKQFEYKTLNTYSEAINRLNEVFEELKKQFNVDYVFNYDIHALSTWFDRNNLDFFRFERVKNTICFGGYLPDIRTDGQIKVLSIGFDDLGAKIDNSFAFVTGYNKSRPEYYDSETDTFFDKNLNICLYWFPEYKRYCLDNVKRIENEAKAWNHFNNHVKTRMSSKKLGERFEVMPEISDYFLNCMPPIWGKGCFYMSEPYDHTPDGKTIYYKFTKSGSKHFVEFNTVS